MIISRMRKDGMREKKSLTNHQCLLLSHVIVGHAHRRCINQHGVLGMLGKNAAKLASNI